MCAERHLVCCCAIPSRALVCPNHPFVVVPCRFSAQHLWTSYKTAREASAKDDTVDDNKDGIADVLQISKHEVRHSLSFNSAPAWPCAGAKECVCARGCTWLSHAWPARLVPACVRTAQLITRKVRVVLTAVDPALVNEALSGLTSGLMAVLVRGQQRGGGAYGRFRFPLSPPPRPPPCALCAVAAHNHLGAGLQRASTRPSTFPS
jgi:hypothetical protein